VRIAIVTESFLPQINGVTNSVLRMCEHLSLHGHQALVIAPGTGPSSWAGVPVIRMPSLPLPGYESHRVGCPWPGMTRTLRAFGPDLACPGGLHAGAQSGRRP
jgi:phosphatidylinositol alpha 1,6-mannosyltransferase